MKWFSDLRCALFLEVSHSWFKIYKFYLRFENSIGAVYLPQVGDSEPAGEWFANFTFARYHSKDN